MMKVGHSETEPAKGASRHQPGKKSGDRIDLTGSRWGGSMDHLLRSLLTKVIRRGSMTFTTASGTSFTCGDGTGHPIHVRFLTKETERRLILNPELALGEAY